MELRRRAGIPRVEGLLTQSQLRWAGHIVRMEESRLPKATFYGELCTGKRGIGRPRVRFKDCLKRHLKACSIDAETWEEKAKDRTAWKGLVKCSVSSIEERLADETQAYHQK